MPRSIAPLSLMLLGGSALAQTAQFIPIPGLGAEPGCNENVCIVSGTGGWSGVRVSGDGSTVAYPVFPPGFTSGYIPRSIARWSPGGTVQEITPGLGGLYPTAVGISSDGNVILGDTWRWSAQNGYENLLPLLVDNRIWRRVFFGMSDDAQTYVGIQGMYPDPGDMFTLRASTGQTTVLPRSAGVATGYSYFNAISGDGRVVGGAARSIGAGSNSFDIYAPVVINGGTPQLITPLVDGNFQGVSDLNTDGSVAVGVVVESFQMRAFRWTAAGGIELLEQGVVGASYARAVSGDGSVVVGEALQFGIAGTTAFVWRAGTGFRDLKQLLEGEFDVNLQGWQLMVATDVSNDGKTIVGQAINPQGFEQAFYVRFDDAPCIADFNQDGGVDGVDVEAFFTAWQVAEPLADVNEDGGVDGGDIESFFILWQAGC
ncbi:MAG: GC-type dockerin domain-anchored protein [Phycisphaerales bacterium]